MHPVGAGADREAGIAVLMPGAEGEELGTTAAQVAGWEQIGDACPFAHGLQQGRRDSLV